VKEDERGGQGRTSTSVFHQSATRHHAANTHCFYTSAFSILYFILSAMDSKIEQCVRIKFCMKFGKSATETLERLHEAFGEYSLSWTAVFEWNSCFKAGQVSVEDDKHSGRPSTSEMTEYVEKNLRTHPQRPSPNNP
jgi:hypothetical protein